MHPPSSAGPVRPPPPPPSTAALQPPRPPGAPAAAPLVPSVAPVVPAVAPAVAPVRPPSSAGPAAPPPPPAAALQPPPPPPAAAGKSLELEPAQLTELWERCARLDQMDYFELLMVEKTVAPSDIKKAFYRESRTYHPDRYFHLQNKELKDRVNELYKRVTEAYYVLRDDAKRRQYTADVTGPERAQKLRFTESSEAETRPEAALHRVLRGRDARRLPTS
ncbi:MAG: DnaJ domain-containing protein, partial [Archangium sp.]